MSRGSRRSGPGPRTSAKLVGQQVIMNPIPRPVPQPKPFADVISIPKRFQVPESQLLPHQVKSGIEIANLFKLLNALQSRIALACSQHQYLRDPANHPKPPDDGGYKPLTAQAAVRDVRALCRQQKNLMEKLRRWNCLNEGKCYDLIMNKMFADACTNCGPFVASKLRGAKLVKLARKTRVKAARKRDAIAKRKAALEEKQKKIQIVAPPAPPPPPPPPPPAPPKRRRKRIISVEQPHPELFLSQENFLSELGLVTPEVYQRTLAESKRTERRRRTTANPKYKSSNFVDPTVTGRSKRSRRSDPESLKIPEEPLAEPSRPGVDRRRAQTKRYECSVCALKDVNVTCNRCMSGFHADCIRVSGSKATIPPTNTVEVCPNCVPCNPNIKSSDCILLSRKICRPSIMGMGSSPAPTTRNRATNPRNGGGGRRGGGRYRSQKQTAKSKTAFKQTYAKRGRPPLKAKQAEQVVKAVTPAPSSSSSSSSSRRTLNHSSAVAAAAAVPAACCTLPRFHMESPPSPDITEPLPYKKVVPPVGIKWNTRHAKLRGGERRRPYPTRDISPPPVTAIKYEGTTSPRRPVKAASLFGTEENVTRVDFKQSAKIKVLQDNGNSQPKSILTNGVSQAMNTKVVTVKRLQTSAKNPNITIQPKVSQIGKPKSVKKEDESPKVAAVISPVIAVKSVPKAIIVNKPTPTPTKKANGSQKSKPLDAFSINRTMLAMSAAAGLVMSNNKLNMSTSGSTSPAPENNAIVKSVLPAPTTGALKPNNASATVFATKSSPLPFTPSPVKSPMLGSPSTTLKASSTTGSSLKYPLSAATGSSKINSVLATPSKYSATPVAATVSKTSLSPSTNEKKAPEISSKKVEPKSGKRLDLPGASPSPPKVTRLVAPVRADYAKYGLITEDTKSISKPGATTGETFDVYGGSSYYTPAPATPGSSKSSSSSSLYSSYYAYDTHFACSTSAFSSSFTFDEVPPAVAGPSGLHLKPSTVLNSTNTAKKKKTYPLKPAPRLNPILEQSISDSISSVILAAASAPAPTLDSDDDTDDEDYKKYLAKTTSAPCSTELNKSGSSSLSTTATKFGGYTDSYDFYDKPPVLVQESYLDDYLPARNYVMDGKNAVTTTYNSTRAVSPAPTHSTIGSSRSVRDPELRESDEDDLLSIPDASIAPLRPRKHNVLPPIESNEPYWTNTKLSSYSASAGSSKATASSAKKGRKVCY